MIPEKRSNPFIGHSCNIRIEKFGLVIISICEFTSLIDIESRYDFQPFAFQSIAQSSYPAEQVDYPYSILFRHIVHSSFKVSIFVQR